MNQKLNIAYIFETVPEDGGNFQTEITNALRLKKIEDQSIKVKFFSNNKKNLQIINSHNLRPILLEKKNISFLLLIFYKFIQNKKIKKILNFLFGINKLEKKLIKEKIDIVHFNGMSPLALQLKKINFGVSFWDSGHLQYPQFPESRNNYYSFENKEYLYKLLLKKSSYVITDSIENKLNLIKQYNVEENKINLIYSEPAIDLLKINENKIASKKEIKSKFDIKNQEYIFYPAQFWPHKNHVYILEAISILKKKFNKDISVVFAGKNKFNNLNHIKNISNSLEINDHVTYAGFVNSEDLYFLYKHAIALVIPTYFGPTNHLPIEGFFVGTPVIYSDLWSETEQVKGAVLSIDLKNANSLSSKIIDLIDNQDIRNEIIHKGKQKYNELSVKIKENPRVFKNLFNTFSIINRNWE